MYSLLICNSNMFIPVTLTEVLSHKERQFIVISDVENIKQFFVFIQLPNVIYHHYGFNPKHDSRFSIFHLRNKLLNFISQYELDCLTFFHTEFGGMANWLIEKLSSKGVVVRYCKLYESIPAPQLNWSLIKMKILFSEFVYYGQRMEVLQGSIPTPSLPQSFFNKVKAITINLPVDVNLNKAFLDEKFKELNIIKGKYLLLTGTAVHDQWYTKEQYIPFINNIINTVGTENIVLKCHPRYNYLYGDENKLVQVPSFIPGNVLLDQFDYYIGLESTLLVEAAMVGKTAISYLDWLCPNEKLRCITHDFFNSRLQGKCKILFPRSKEEFISLLK